MKLEQARVEVSGTFSNESFDVDDFDTFCDINDMNVMKEMSSEDCRRPEHQQSWTEFFQRCYRRYTYVTGVSLLEPWEKRIVNAR